MHILSSRIVYPTNSPRRVNYVSKIKIFMSRTPNAYRYRALQKVTRTSKGDLVDSFRIPMQELVSVLPHV